MANLVPAPTNATKLMVIGQLTKKQATTEGAAANAKMETEIYSRNSARITQDAALMTALRAAAINGANPPPSPVAPNPIPPQMHCRPDYSGSVICR